MAIEESDRPILDAMIKAAIDRALEKAPIPTYEPGSVVGPAALPGTYNVLTDVDATTGGAPVIAQDMTGSTSLASGTRVQVALIASSGAQIVGFIGTPGGSLPVGAEIFCLALSIPGWLLENGATFDPNTYPALAAFLGGSTLPNPQGRALVAAGAGPGLTARNLGSTGGSETPSLPAHTHSTKIETRAEIAAGGNSYGRDHGSATSGDLVIPTGAIPAGGNMMPWVARNWFIKAI